MSAPGVVVMVVGTPVGSAVGCTVGVGCGTGCGPNCASMTAPMLKRSTSTITTAVPIYHHFMPGRGAWWKGGTTGGGGVACGSASVSCVEKEPGATWEAPFGSPLSVGGVLIFVLFACFFARRSSKCSLHTSLNDWYSEERVAYVSLRMVTSRSGRVTIVSKGESRYHQKVNMERQSVVLRAALASKLLTTQASEYL